MRFLIAIFAAFLISNSSMAASTDFNSLRYLLIARDNEPKMYLPNVAILGSKLKIIIDAPNSTSIKLLASKKIGKTKYKNLDLALDENYYEVGTSEKQRAIFDIDIKEDMIGKPLFFDTVISYKDPVRGEILDKASFYGPNANFSNINQVAIIDKPADGNSAANLARNFMPGLFRAGSNF